MIEANITKDFIMIQRLQTGGVEATRKKQGKRMLATFETTKVELKNELLLLFQTFEEAMVKANKALAFFPTYSRSRTLEASVVQSCFAEVLVKNFEGKAFFGKYKRLVLQAKGYVILFKKLDNNGYPMNVKTMNVQSMLNQNQILDLFQDTEYNYDPIVFFGYKKNKFGQYINPQLVYIDENQISFTIELHDLQLPMEFTKPMQHEIVQQQVVPSLKTKINIKEAK